MKKKLPYILLSGIALLAVIFSMKGGTLYGSVTDWLNQHSVFPDYFRKLFYETGALFPNFAPHLGAGQNIFHFAYYGLYNPFILLSYCFPMIPMTTYLIGINILIFLLDGCLMYYFLKHHYSKKASFVASVLFLCATPLLFHGHRHWMFVSYMPFLILSLVGVDRHFQGKSALLIGSVFLMILTSYYYSVGGIIAVSVYGIYRYLEQHKKIVWKQFFLDGFKFCIPILLSVLLASFLLFPIIKVMLANPSRMNDTVSLATLLRPKLNLGGILYGSYALGLTSIAVIALLYSLTTKKKQELFLGVFLFVLLSVPFFRYLLNGALYLKNKAFISFLPLFILVLASFFETYWKEKKKTYLTLGILLLATFYFLFLGHSFRDYVLDFGVTIFFLLASLHWKKEEILIIPILLIAFGITVGTSRTDTLIQQEEYQKKTQLEILNEVPNTFSRTENLIATGENINRNYPNYGTSIYSSTYNEAYHEFYKTTFHLAMPHRNLLMNGSSKNFLWETYMGVEYLISSSAPFGYQKIMTKDGVNLYQNQQVYPLGYARSKLIDEKTLLKLSYPQRVEALFQGIVTQNGSKEITTMVRKVDFLSQITSQKNVTVKIENGQMIVEVTKPTTIKIPLPELYQHRILLLTFDVLEKQNCSKGDLSIDINGVSNKLTCKEWGYNNQNTNFSYVLAEEEIKELTVTFSSGTFRLGNWELYQLDPQVITDSLQELDPWHVETIHGNTYKGTIEVTADGYFATSIPYDEGFVAFVDGKEVPIEKVNTAFVGFPITKGKHTIQLVYYAPGSFTGKLLTGSGFLLTGIFLWGERTWKKKKEKRKN